MNQERVPGWTWISLVVASIVIGVATWWFSQPEKKLAKQPPEAREIQEKKIEVTVPPDRYIEVPLPYYHWFNLVSNEPFQVKLVDGREFDFRPGQPQPWLGNEVPASRLGLKSLTGKEVRVTIFVRPKTGQI